VWRDVKAHGMPWRTQTTLGEAYKAVEEALAQKAKRLQQKHCETKNLLTAPT
ncbi:MAG: hypothetical protein H7308_13660, partial [Chthonomonadaceae bacterium]|nr:hypothetical protein [Chthonomonadaceae bacterium]